MEKEVINKRTSVKKTPKNVSVNKKAVVNKKTSVKTNKTNKTKNNVNEIKKIKVSTKKTPETKKIEGMQKTKKIQKLKKVPEIKNIKNIKNEKIKRTKKSKIKIVVVFFVIAILVCVIYLLFTLQNFNVTSYKVTGTDKYTSEEIAQNLGFKQNENIFIQIIKSIKKDNPNLPYIESVNLKVNMPNEIKFDVVQRKSVYFGFNKEKNNFYKISSNGYILEETNIDEKTKEELLTYGITFNNEVVIGEKINDIDISKFQIYEKIKEEYLKSGIKGDITKVNFENSLTTITINDKLNVVLSNDTNIKYNINFLKTIMGNIGSDSVGVIDMTKTNPTFSSF